MKRQLLSLLLLLSVVFGLRAADLVEGRLDNGLTYYILQNDKPAGMADFFLVQRAGSVYEEDDQRGLAHFLEHMCFNGTEHFPDNSLISYLESIGVKFGANLNAYTSTDETVYNISKVPVTRTSTVDSCLLILKDWSSALTLDPKAIDDERGVIVNEWRHRNSPANRMLEKALPAIYPGSIYGHRMPIGKMEIVENFRPETLAAFYQKWYHPGNQAVIVVGDINPSAVQSEIEKLFSSIPAGKNLITKRPEVPANEKMIVEVQSDPEQTVNMVQLYFRHPRFTDTTVADLATTMLASRFDEVEHSPDCPHTYLGVGDVKFLLSSDVSALVMRGAVKEGRVEDAASLWYTELIRALQHGFSEDELEYAKIQMRKNLNEKKRKGAVSDNTSLAKRLTHVFLDRDSFETSVEEADRELATLETLTAEDALNYLKKVVDLSGRNTVLLCYLPESAIAPAVAPASSRYLPSAITDRFAQIASTPQPPFVPLSTDKPLLASEPTSGTILSSEPYHFENTTLYTLSNGIKVITWANDKTKDQIFLRGIGTGGLSQTYTPEQAPTMKMINDLVAVSGFGGHSNLELKRLLAGRDVACSVDIKNTEEIVEASTTRAGLEDAFRLIYLKSTDIQPDTLAFNSWLTSQRNKLRNVHTNPIQAMGDSIHRNVYNRHPLGLKETPEMLDAVDYAKALEIARDRFSDMADFTFYITGDFDRDSVENLITRYIATLPTAGRVEKPKDIDYKFTPRSEEIRFSREMENPVSVVYNFYHGPADYSLENIIGINIFNQVLKMRLLADLREERGWTYSIQGHGSVSAGMNGDDAPELMMPVYIKTEPGHEQETADIVNATVVQMLAQGVTPEEFDKARQYMIKNHKEHQLDNAYLLSVLKVYDRYGKDMHTPYLDTLEQMTSLPSTLAPLTTYRSLLIMEGEPSKQP